MICGTQKGGTTALHAYFSEHPEICMADPKEVHFFDNEDHFANGKPNYSRYHDFFQPKRSHKVLGEASPIYMYWNEAPRRIFEYNPKTKIIVVLRNPIERAYSHWNMERSRHADRLPFAEAIRTEAKRCREALPLQHRVFSYIDRGHYINQLRRIWTYFPRDRVLVLKQEELRCNPAETLNQASTFLGITPFSNVEPKSVHTLPYNATMAAADRDFLRTTFAAGIKELEQELQWDCSDWLKP